jgi:hypothetical protein
MAAARCVLEISFISDRATTVGGSARSRMSLFTFLARNITPGQVTKIHPLNTLKIYYAGFFGALSRLWRTIVNFTFDFGFPDGYV